MRLSAELNPEFLHLVVVHRNERLWIYVAMIFAALVTALIGHWLVMRSRARNGAGGSQSGFEGGGDVEVWESMREEGREFDREAPASLVSSNGRAGWKMLFDVAGWYVFRIIYHTPITLVAFLTACIYGFRFEEAAVITGVLFGLIWGGDWIMTRDTTSEKRAHYRSQTWGRAGMVLGFFVLSFVRAPVSYWLAGNPEPLKSPVEWIAATILLTAFVVHMINVATKPQKEEWVVDLMANLRRLGDRMAQGRLRPAIGEAATRR